MALTANPAGACGPHWSPFLLPALAISPCLTPCMLTLARAGQPPAGASALFCHQHSLLLPGPGEGKRASCCHRHPTSRLCACQHPLSALLGHTSLLLPPGPLVVVVVVVGPAHRLSMRRPDYSGLTYQLPMLHLINTPNYSAFFHPRKWGFFVGPPFCPPSPLR